MLYACDIHIDAPVRFPGSLNSRCAMSSIVVPRPRHASQYDAFDQFVVISWILSEAAFEVFGMFFWAALLLFYVKAIS